MSYLDTERSLYEIEIALAKKFEYLKNIIVFNVKGESEDLPIWHECDCIVLSKSGYLTEIEIKRSWQDFLNDFKKKNRERKSLIKYFYYCVPEKLLDKVYERLDEEREKDKNFIYTGIITYDEDLNLKEWNFRYKFGMDEKWSYATPALHNKKLYLEQRLTLARLGCIKTIKEKKKAIALQKLNNEVSAEQEEMIEEIIDVEIKEGSLF